MRKIDIAYLAGLVDGEGYITVKKTPAYKCQHRRTNAYHAFITVSMVDEGAIRFLADTLGGSYYGGKPHANDGRPLFVYQAADKRAGEILRTLLPYLRVKRLAAMAVLELRELQATRTAHRTKLTGYRDFPDRAGTIRRAPNLAFSDEYVARCDALWLRCKALNAVGMAGVRARAALESTVAV